MNIIDRAIEHLHQGWTRGRRRDGFGNVCALGALDAAANEMFGDVRLRTTEQRDYKSAAVKAVQKIIREETGVHGITFFNDIRARDVDDVIHVFKKASERFDMEAPAQPERE